MRLTFHILIIFALFLLSRSSPVSLDDLPNGLMSADASRIRHRALDAEGTKHHDGANCKGGKKG
ncbi:unnamed protein product [Acanthoscelides obtectus]|uniref:Uncharacterized protein n=1 Tax=Acanthoscelides obtectus TaxID=200917 RepID=A0A9P0LF16_ACAOB|nr:unnamed protein product [Acanthoscelides obtectus]CAK1644843.1 hypothetical protein AOBTE_LOCUS13956 [Acanthoscelides obtectus]